MEVPKSMLYKKFCKYDKGEINIKTVEELVQTFPSKSVAMQTTSVTVPEASMMETPKEFNILTWISKHLR